MAALHLSDLVYKPLLEEKAWGSERRVILREWRKEKNDSITKYTNCLLPILFPGQPSLRYNPLGRPKTIHAISISDLKDLHQREYTANNCQLVLTGKLDEGWLETLNSTFGQLCLPVGESKRIVHAVSSIGGQRINIQHHMFEEPTIGSWGMFPCPDESTILAISIFCEMLGRADCLSSPLFQELREKRNLLYEYDLDFDQILPGALRINFCYSTQLTKLQEVHDRFWQVTQRTMGNSERFLFAKERKIGRMRMFSPDAEADAMDISDQLLYDGQYTSDEKLERIIDKITFEEVRAAAQFYFDPSNFCVFCMKR